MRLRPPLASALAEGHPGQRTLNGQQFPLGVQPTVVAEGQRLHLFRQSLPELLKTLLQRSTEHGDQSMDDRHPGTCVLRPCPQSCETFTPCC